MSKSRDAYWKKNVAGRGCRKGKQEEYDRVWKMYELSDYKPEVPIYQLEIYVLAKYDICVI